MSVRSTIFATGSPHFKVTVQFETEGNGQNEILAIWIDQK